MWKPGQIVTIDNKLYRVTKASMHGRDSSTCAQCRIANAQFKRHDEDTCCPSWQLRWKCMTLLSDTCFLKPIN